jgi:hypothetical protein
MKNKFLIGAASAVMLLGAAVPAFAQTSTSTDREQNREDKKALITAKERTQSDKEIDRRIADLNKLITRVQQFRNIPPSQTSSIVATIQGLITNLNNLKTEIDSTASSTVLKNDKQAITQANRIYALAIPQLQIVASADRMITIVSMMTAVGTKIQTRLAQEPTVAAMPAVQTAFTDYSAKLNDSKSLAEAAFAQVSPLVPDQGDKAKMTANTAALKDARTKLQTAQKDLKAARKDAETIIQALVKADKSMMGDLKGNVNGKNGTTTGTTTHQ